jgi:hypothetical protein
MNSHVILKELVKRLEDEGVQLPKRGARSYWEADAEKAQDWRKKALAGEGHKAEALRQARAALASGDEARIAEAALFCPSLERTGEKLAQRNRRRVGGKHRGEDLRSAAEGKWAALRKEYDALLAGGSSPAMARKKILRKAEKHGEKISPRTARKWLPTKRK